LGSSVVEDDLFAMVRPNARPIRFDVGVGELDKQFKHQVPALYSEQRVIYCALYQHSGQASNSINSKELLKSQDHSLSAVVLSKIVTMLRLLRRM
jgi:hypothetical protein